MIALDILVPMVVDCTSIGQSNYNSHNSTTKVRPNRRRHVAFTFLKRGAESAKLAQRAAIEAEQRKSEQGKMFRFWMKEKEEARITFVDGELAKEGPLKGLLDPPRYWEHNLFLSGVWNNFFVCPEKTNPDSGEKCPLCESGDRPSLVSLFTIIDHRQIQSKDKTKTYKDTRKLLVAKPQTFELLTKHAMKRGGLAGCTFDASRVGDKSASVGSMFDFVEKKPIEDLKKLYMVEKTDPKTNVKMKVPNFIPADYDKEIEYRTADQLKELTKGGAGDDIPFDNGSDSAATGAVDYSKEL